MVYAFEEHHATNTTLNKVQANRHKLHEGKVQQHFFLISKISYIKHWKKLPLKKLRFMNLHP